MIKRQNLQGQVLDELGRRIATGGLAPGTQLAPEAQLADELGVSRTVAREALKGLAARGLVSAKPRSGTRVTPRSEWQLFDEDVLRWRLDRPDNLDDLIELIDLRRMVEPAAARLATERGDPDVAQAVWAAYQDLLASKEDPPRWVAATAALHGALLEGCGNPFVANLARVLRTAILYSRNRTRPALSRVPPEAVEGNHPTAVDEALGRYGDLARAVRDGDGPSAEAASRGLLDRARLLLVYLRDSA